MHRVKAERKAKKKAEKAKVAELAEKRRSKEVNVNTRLTSISGVGGLSGVVCHSCGKKEHFKGDCPDRRKKRRSAVGGDRLGRESLEEQVLDY